MKGFCAIINTGRKLVTMNNHEPWDWDAIESDLESISIKAVEEHGLYAKYSNGDEICWGFECTCKYQGNCGICPKLAESEDLKRRSRMRGW